MSALSAGRVNPLFLPTSTEYTPRLHQQPGSIIQQRKHILRGSVEEAWSRAMNIDKDRCLSATWLINYLSASASSSSPHCSGCILTLASITPGFWKIDPFRQTDGRPYIKDYRYTRIGEEGGEPRSDTRYFGLTLRVPHEMNPLRYLFGKWWRFIVLQPASAALGIISLSRLPYSFGSLKVYCRRTTNVLWGGILLFLPILWFIGTRIEIFW